MCLEDHLPASYAQHLQAKQTPGRRLQNAAAMLHAIAREVSTLPDDAGDFAPMLRDAELIRNRARAHRAGNRYHCEQCDKLFVPVRSDARYCSGRCRAAAARARRTSVR